MKSLYDSFDLEEGFLGNVAGSPATPVTSGAGQAVRGWFDRNVTGSTARATNLARNAQVKSNRGRTSDVGALAAARQRSVDAATARAQTAQRTSAISDRGAPPAPAPAPVATAPVPHKTAPQQFRKPAPVAAPATRVASISNPAATRRTVDTADSAGRAPQARPVPVQPRAVDTADSAGQPIRPSITRTVTPPQQRQTLGQRLTAQNRSAWNRGDQFQTGGN